MTHASSFIRTISALVVMSTCVSAQAAWQSPGMATDQIAAAQDIPAPGITTSVSASSYFNITAADIGKAVAEQIQQQAVETKAEVSLAAGSPQILYSADHPLKLTIHSLQIDPQAKRWQAQAYILAAGKTETVKPISGTYIAMIDVPVLTRQLGRTDVIEQTDLGTKTIPDRLMRKDVVTDPKQLIGQSPRAIISANRPIRASEVNAPLLIKKGEPVNLTYTNKYMSLKTTGVALQDGAQGEMIRVKNDKSEKSVSGRVASAGHVEVNSEPAL